MVDANMPRTAQGARGESSLGELEVLVEHEDVLGAVMSGERRLMSASEAWQAND
jgi:hypothetical protein